MNVFDELNLIAYLTHGVGPCSLDRSPRSNWVQKNGGLPNYICHIARAITKNGHSIQEAIPMAIGTAKRWAAGGTTNGTARAKHVHPVTMAKAAAAVAQWEALRARAHAGHVVKASHPRGGQYLMLTSVGSFNTDMVRQAWRAMQNDLQLGYHHVGDIDHDGDDDSPKLASGWITELGSDYIIVEYYDGDDGAQYARYSYTVDGNTVKFGDPVQVKQAYVPVNEADGEPEGNDDPDGDGDDDVDDPDDDQDDELTPEEEQMALDENPLPRYSPLEKISRAAGY